MSLIAEVGRTGSRIGYDAIEVREPIHPKCRRLLNYWLARCKDDGVPARRDFNPFDLPDLMGGMSVTEPVDGGADIRFRLVSATNEQRLGMSMMGRLMSECYAPGPAAEQIAIHNRVMSGTTPVVLRGNFLDIDIEYARFECIYLPVRAETGLQVIGGLYDMAQTD
ncbi:MAG: PAS domain-containing protein [Parvibaculum sp.]|nr:PAS domain-containing protein [Parvibaculum sp.]